MMLPSVVPAVLVHAEVSRRLGPHAAATVEAYTFSAQRGGRHGTFYVDGKVFTGGDEGHPGNRLGPGGGGQKGA
jgi:hypothetical protein